MSQILAHFAGWLASPGAQPRLIGSVLKLGHHRLIGQLDYSSEIREAVPLRADVKSRAHSRMDSLNPTIGSLVDAAGQGDRAAADALFATLYSELHGLARRQLARQGVPLGLSATTLLHQAYLDIAAREGSSFPDRARFMGYAARVMRGLIIDHARNRQAQKRGGLFEITSLSTDALENSVDFRELESISDALDQLGKTESSLAEIVDLKFFCGFSFAEIATMRAVSERTVQRNWEKARIYLHRNLRGTTPL